MRAASVFTACLVLTVCLAATVSAFSITPLLALRGRGLTHAALRRPGLVALTMQEEVRSA
jgi:hypothetical protein